MVGILIGRVVLIIGLFLILLVISSYDVVLELFVLVLVVVQFCLQNSIGIIVARRILLALHMVVVSAASLFLLPLGHHGGIVLDGFSLLFIVCVLATRAILPRRHGCVVPGKRKRTCAARSIVHFCAEFVGIDQVVRVRI